MWTLDESGAPPLWRLPAGALRPRAAFTTRRGGVSATPYDSLNLGRSTPDRAEDVLENRRRTLAALGLGLERLATAGQVHGARVAEVRAPGHVAECDALVTRARDVALAITTADCLPLVLIAPGAVGVAHCGWRGTAAGLPRAALAAVTGAAGVAPGAVEVHLGPCIRPCCYEVGPEVARRFPAEASALVDGRHRLDLATAARHQLLDAGASPGRLFDTAACTCCAPAWYFSHRRDGPRSGRHWALVAITRESEGSGRGAQDGPGV